VEITYPFLFFGILGAILNTGIKRSVCTLYVVGLTLELAVSWLYEGLGLLDTYPYHYYFSIILIDLSILAIASLFYFHHDYILVYVLMGLMVGINAILAPERVLLDLDVILEHSRAILEMINITVLLIFFDRNGRVQRIMDKFWRTTHHSGTAFTGRLLRVGAGKKSR